MELRDELFNKLGQVNCVQLIGEDTHIHAYLWNKDTYRWVELGVQGASQRVMATHEMVTKLMEFPHETRRRGSLLVVTKVDPLKAE